VSFFSPHPSEWALKFKTCFPHWSIQVLQCMWNLPRNFGWCWRATKLQDRLISANSSVVCKTWRFGWCINWNTYRVFQKEWTDFELLSWSYYMQGFAKTTFNVRGIIWHFMSNFYKPINFSQKKRYFKHIARNLHFLCLPLDDWDTLLSGLQTRRNRTKTIKGAQSHRFCHLQC